MADTNHITKEYLHEIFQYKDGLLYWKKKASKHSPVKIGSIAGNVKNDGYYAVKILFKSYSLHRIIFMYHYGFFPEEVDHIDNNKSNNLIENLRASNRKQNMCNTRTPITNTSGVKGVVWHKRDKKWSVQLMLNRKRHSFGYYDDFELAELVMQMAREKYHGNFANHG